jgi:hypothetical protein
VPEYRQYETPQSAPAVAALPNLHDVILVSNDQVK